MKHHVGTALMKSARRPLMKEDVVRAQDGERTEKTGVREVQKKAETERNREEQRGPIKALFAALDSEQQEVVRCEWLHPRRSSLALVSFGELHCPPWAARTPVRRAVSLLNRARRLFSLLLPVVQHLTLSHVFEWVSFPPLFLCCL